MTSVLPRQLNRSAEMPPSVDLARERGSHRRGRYRSSVDEVGDPHIRGRDGVVHAIVGRVRCRRLRTSVVQVERAANVHVRTSGSAGTISRRIAMQSACARSGLSWTKCHTSRAQFSAWVRASERVVSQEGIEPSTRRLRDAWTRCSRRRSTWFRAVFWSRECGSVGLGTVLSGAVCLTASQAPDGTRERQRSDPAWRNRAMTGRVIAKNRPWRACAVTARDIV